jgi:hypothetical protein
VFEPQEERQQVQEDRGLHVVANVPQQQLRRRHRKHSGIERFCFECRTFFLNSEI